MNCVKGQVERGFIPSKLVLGPLKTARGGYLTYANVLRTFMRIKKNNRGGFRGPIHSLRQTTIYN